MQMDKRILSLSLIFMIWIVGCNEQQDEKNNKSDHLIVETKSREVRTLEPTIIQETEKKQEILVLKETQHLSNLPGKSLKNISNDQNFDLSFYPFSSDHPESFTLKCIDKYSGEVVATAEVKENKVVSVTEKTD